MNEFQEVFDEKGRQRARSKARIGAGAVSPIHVEVTDLMKFGQDDGFTPGSNDEETWVNLEATSGQHIKDFLKACLAYYNIEYDERRLNGFNKNELIHLFFDLFDVYPKAGADPMPSPPTEVIIDHEQSARPEEPETPEKPAPVSLNLTQELTQKIYDNGRKIPVADKDPQFDISENINLYQDLPITIADHVSLSCSKPELFATDLMLIINPRTGKVAAAGRLVDAPLDNGTEKRAPHFICETENIDFTQFQHQVLFDFALLPANWQRFIRAGQDQVYAGDIYIFPGVKMRLGTLPESDRPLCIDFGTSNTTAGTYGIKSDVDRDIALVKFQDATKPALELNEMLPTMVYVQSCGLGDPVYLFGYDARKKLEEDDYTPNASCFFEIKRWLNSMNKEEPIEDSEGGQDKVKRGEIIYAYLRHVLKIAEQQFKKRFTKLHFTAPVKQKGYFLEALSQMFEKDGRQVLDPVNSLDEATAIIYHSALKIFRERNEKDLDILILDCGGGTTDLANCKCEYTSSGNSKYLNIKTSFESGDSNFGGNNITFRILQMLKIKIASIRQGRGHISMDTLIPLDENAILTEIDTAPSTKMALDAIYKEFNEAYDQAERYIPTRFRDVEHKNEKKYTRRNFYYLWKMAEAIKIDFFNHNKTIMDEKEAKAALVPLGDNFTHYYLSVRESEDGPLTKLENPLADVEITYKEIDRLLYPDIYALLDVLLGMDNKEKFTYHLSGQSCKIALFKNLLKEFIPGKQLRSKGQKDTAPANSEKLKKFCIQGSIEYMRDRDTGAHRPRIEQEKINHIYDISFTEETDPLPLLSHDRQGNILLGMLERPKSTQHIRMDITDKLGDKIHTFQYDINRGAQKRYRNLDETIEEIGKYMPEGSDALNRQIKDNLLNLKLDPANEEGAFCIFAIPAGHAYGARIVQVYAKQSDDGLTYQLAKDAPFEPYENETFHTYFEGTR